ncbi:hypothetical protein D3C87_1705920 [compost metagenome]
MVAQPANDVPVQEIARAQRQCLVIGGAVEIDRSVAGLEDQCTGHQLAVMPHEEQFGPERLVHGHEGIERIESRIVRELLAIAHGRVKRLEVLDAVRTRMLEHEAGLLGLAELPPPGLAKALALGSIGKA